MKQKGTHLIISMPGDVHALAVDLGLKLKGHASHRWLTSELPKKQRHSFYIDNKRAVAWQTSLPFKPIEVSAVWFRRPLMPKVLDILSEDERSVAEQESALFIKALFPFLGQNVFWINSLSSLAQANNKLHQLKIAKQSGFTIPPTLVSNDKNEVKKFIKQYKNVIYKTFFPAVFQDACFYPAKITQRDLPPANILKYTPGIFQQQIPKAYELRITMLGNHPIAVKISYQKTKHAIIDWGELMPEELHYQPYKLPRTLKEALIDFMKKLGIVFGCFDIIVTPEKEYVFLELNEQGQFLWLEAYNPEIKLLDPFLHFLCNKSFNFKYAPKNALSLTKDVFENKWFKKNYQLESKSY